MSASPIIPAGMSTEQAILLKALADISGQLRDIKTANINQTEELRILRETSARQSEEINELTVEVRKVKTLQSKSATQVSSVSRRLDSVEMTTAARNAEPGGRRHMSLPPSPALRLREGSRPRRNLFGSGPASDSD